MSEDIEKLARELSLVDEILLAKKKKKPPKPKHSYKYLIIVDFEATCWENYNLYGNNRNKVKQEIIEFPACILNLETGEIESEFHQYVRPTENPVLSEYCINLTGIQQEWVDKGIPLRDCVRDFLKYMKTEVKSRNLLLPKYKNSNLDGNCLMVTWSNWDFQICLSRECSRKKIRKPSFFNQWMDLKQIFTERYNRKERYNFISALTHVGMEFEGQQHSGIVDSRNIARLAHRMHKDNAFFRVTTDLNPNSLNRSF